MLLIDVNIMQVFIYSCDMLKYLGDSYYSSQSILLWRDDIRKDVSSMNPKKLGKAQGKFYWKHHTQ